MQIGEMFDGKYKIVEILGQGGMGKVYLAENVKLGTYWAIKEIYRDAGLGLDLLAEPNILKKLDHPSLPRIFDIVEFDHCIYVIVDYIEGISLERKLAAEGRICEELVAIWAEELCDALGYLHSLKPNPIIYRDMKPSNIIISKSGKLKLIDFGIAREFKPQSGSDTVFIGTRGYAAPEQYGGGQTNAASDIFSLGAMLHQLLTGKDPNQAPYEPKPIRYYDSSLSAGFESIISKCTRLSPAERYQSAYELLQDIRLLKMTLAGDDEYSDAGDSLEGSENGVSGDSMMGRSDVRSSCHKVRSDVSGSSDKTSSDKGKLVSGWDLQSNRKARQVIYKKTMLTVWDNPEFGCELAYAAARLTGLSVLLADLDLLAPKADIYLNISRSPMLDPDSGIIGSSGINRAIDSIEKSHKSPNMLMEAASRRKDLKNLFVLTGNDRIENYEYYRDETLTELLDKACSSFDLTILLVNRSIYDSFTVISLARSDVNLAALRADVDKLREFNSYVAFLKDKQKIPMDKTKFIAFEYDRSVNLSLDELNGATGGNLAGKVSFSRKRAALRNTRKPYATVMEKEAIKEYAALLDSIGITKDCSLLARASTSLNSLVKAAGLSI